MQAATRSNYLHAEVQAAAPQKLQLLLIEAAIRAIHQAARALDQGRPDDIDTPLVQAQQVVRELLDGLRTDRSPELVTKVRGIYLFVFQSLVGAQIRRDAKRLTEALEVLQIERDTWREVCERLRGCIPAEALVSARFELEG